MMNGGGSGLTAGSCPIEILGNRSGTERNGPVRNETQRNEVAGLDCKAGLDASRLYLTAFAARSVG